MKALRRPSRHTQHSIPFFIGSLLTFHDLLLRYSMHINWLIILRYSISSNSKGAFFPSFHLMNSFCTPFDSIILHLLFSWIARPKRIQTNEVFKIPRILKKISLQFQKGRWTFLYTSFYTWSDLMICFDPSVFPQNFEWESCGKKSAWFDNSYLSN